MEVEPNVGFIILKTMVRELRIQRSAVPSYFNVTHLSGAAPSGQSVPCNMQRMQKAYQQTLVILFLHIT